MEGFTLSTIDLIVMAAYIIGIILYGLAKSKNSSSEDYFLGGRDMTWPIVGISLFAANIGSNTLIGLAGDAYRTNVAVYNYEWMAAVVLVFFAIFFLPFYLKTKVYTMPEFLERRFDARSRYYFSGITIIGNVIIDTASGLYAGNLILKLIFPEISSEVIIIGLALAAAAYTIPGGLSSVVHTEVIQAILLLLSAILLTYFSLSEIGGWDNFITGLNELKPEGKDADEVLSLVKSNSDPDMPWLGLLFGVPLLGFYFWANNQFMVQRVLSAKDLNHGRWGAIFAGLLKLPVLFFMVLPGAFALVLYHNTDISALNYMATAQDGSQFLCTNLADCPNMTYPFLIYKLMPVGLLGLVIAGLLAAMSSSISATLNSASTLITMDFVNKLNPNMTSKGLVRAGQIATVALVVLAALWAPQIEKFSSLFTYLQTILGLICPPVVAVFLLGLFWPRANGNGAFAALIGGFFIAMFTLMSQSLGWWPALNDLHFLYKAPILLVICMIILTIVSLATAAPPAIKTNGLIYTKEVFDEDTRSLEGLVWYKNYRILSIFLLIITAIIVVIFW